MKREDLRSIEGLTDAQVDAVMVLAGRDSTAAHAREEQLQQQLTAAQQGLAAFGTQKPADLAAALQQVQQLQTQLDQQAADFRGGPGKGHPGALPPGVAGAQDGLLSVPAGEHQ